MTTLLLRNARLLGTDTLRDVLIDDGLVAALTPAGTLPEADETVDLAGRVLAPGLWDHHVHFTQLVIGRSRFDLSATSSAADVLERVREVLAARDCDAAHPITGYGFRDGTWPDAPTQAALDAVAGQTPVVLVSGDLHCAWISSAAAKRMGVVTDESGVIREEAWLNVPPHLRDPGVVSAQSVRAAAEAAARRGIVGIVEFEQADNIAQWPEWVEHGVDLLRVETSIWPEFLGQALAVGRRTGQVLDPQGLVTVGPLKVVVDGSLNTRTAWCWDPYPTLPEGAPHRCGVATVPPEALRELLESAVSAGLAPAIHAIGDRANTAVLELFAELGIAGTIEHAQLVREEDFARFGELGLTASVQPEHALDDRDVAELHWSGRTGRAFAFRSLLDGGATLRLGSDAPVAPLDPWITIAAAVHRTRAGREAWHPEQELTLAEALAASMRGRTTIAVGDVADLVVLDLDPYAATPEQLRELPVAATLLGGRWTWRSL